MLLIKNDFNTESYIIKTKRLRQEMSLWRTSVFQALQKVRTVRILKWKKFKYVSSGDKNQQNSRKQKGYYCTKKGKRMIQLFLSPLSCMHEVKSLIYLLKGQGVGHKLIHLQLLIQIVFHQFRNTLHTFPACGVNIKTNETTQIFNWPLKKVTCYLTEQLKRQEIFQTTTSHFLHFHSETKAWKTSHPFYNCAMAISRMNKTPLQIQIFSLESYQSLIKCYWRSLKIPPISDHKGFELLEIQNCCQTTLNFLKHSRSPPKAVPLHTRPVTSWNGLVEISCPAPATPIMTLSPHPLWHASRAAL